MVRAFVVHWDAASIPQMCARLRAAGADVVGSESSDGQRAYSEAGRLGIDLLVVWLQWKPSHGRVTAAAIRSSPWGRTIPILFIDGDPDAVPAATLQRVKAAVPGAIVDRPERLAFWVERIAAMRQRTVPPAPSAP